MARPPGARHPPAYLKRAMNQIIKTPTADTENRLRPTTFSRYGGDDDFPAPAPFRAPPSVRADCSEMHSSLSAPATSLATNTFVQWTLQPAAGPIDMATMGHRFT